MHVTKLISDGYRPNSFFGVAEGFLKYHRPCASNINFYWDEKISLISSVELQTQFPAQAQVIRVVGKQICLVDFFCNSCHVLRLDPKWLQLRIIFYSITNCLWLFDKVASIRLRISPEAMPQSWLKDFNILSRKTGTQAISQKLLILQQDWVN